MGLLSNAQTRGAPDWVADQPARFGMPLSTYPEADRAAGGPGFARSQTADSSFSLTEDQQAYVYQAALLDRRESLGPAMDDQSPGGSYGYGLYDDLDVSRSLGRLEIKVRVCMRVPVLVVVGEMIGV